MQELYFCGKMKSVAEVSKMDNNINLSVSEEVISTIVEKTVMSVPGVYDIPGGIIDGITNILGSKKTRGIKVEINDKTITLDVYVIVEYGVKIPDIAWDIQDKVKKTLEEIVGMAVKAVNIHIQGINFKNKKENQ